ncbi:PREDICTED: uncharacterized protein LOC105570036 isoform X2 [Vollenhovia emeryi]|uniref:uncharacterized protein LOC105570036 isoform X2 n=1 Tax=Vollenhovia emeryi TaxID=411798 RepID=UPI0005F44F5C|nr:PREDICTED: uncharacterized protein LOC105570036 isoform X2 [Vollenhovia emeryi]
MGSTYRLNVWKYLMDCNLKINWCVGHQGRSFSVRFDKKAKRELERRHLSPFGDSWKAWKVSGEHRPKGGSLVLNPSRISRPPDI